MAVMGYIKIPDIDGESVRSGHEDEAEFIDLEWGMEQTRSESGRGLVSGRPQVDVITVTRAVDAASAYLMQACLTAKNFDEVVFTVRKRSGEEHLDYFTITIKDASCAGWSTEGSDEHGVIIEKTKFAFRSLNVKYIVQNDDFTAGDEHEIEYDIYADT